MASRVNSDFAYINLINGETVWERLRIVRNFIEDRKAAKAIKPASELKRQAIQAKIGEATKTSDRLFAEAELIEFDAMQATQDDGYVKLEDELKFLLEYEAQLAQAADQVRIEGKTDDEMYQLNMPYEVYLRNIRKMQTERVALVMGISQATAEESMRVPTLRKQMLATATLMSLPQTQDNVALIEQLKLDALDFDHIPVSVQEQLQLDSSLLLKGISNETDNLASN